MLRHDAIPTVQEQVLTDTVLACCSNCYQERHTLQHAATQGLRPGAQLA